MKKTKDNARGREILDAMGGHKFIVATHSRHFRARRSKLSFLLDESKKKLKGNYVEIYYNKDVNRYDLKFIRLDPVDRTSRLLKYILNVKEDSLLPTFSMMTNIYNVSI